MPAFSLLLLSVTLPICSAPPMTSSSTASNPNSIHSKIPTDYPQNPWGFITVPIPIPMGIPIPTAALGKGDGWLGFYASSKRRQTRWAQSYWLYCCYILHSARLRNCGLTIFIKETFDSWCWHVKAAVDSSKQRYMDMRVCSSLSSLDEHITDEPWIADKPTGSW